MGLHETKTELKRNKKTRKAWNRNAAVNFASDKWLVSKIYKKDIKAAKSK